MKTDTGYFRDLYKRTDNRVVTDNRLKPYCQNGENIMSREKSNHYNSFISKGWYDFGNILDKKKCKKLFNHILKDRPLTKNIFYRNKNELKKKGRFNNYSPGEKNHNFLLDQNIDLSFIEDSKLFKDNVGKIMGNNYKIMK